jgi:glutamate dehydrogenase
MTQTRSGQDADGSRTSAPDDADTAGATAGGTVGAAPAPGVPEEVRAAGESATAEAIRRRPDLAKVISAYLRHVPVEDRPRRPDDVLAVVEGHLRTASERRPGEIALRIRNPPQGTASSGERRADGAPADHGHPSAAPAPEAVDTGSTVVTTSGPHTVSSMTVAPRGGEPHAPLAAWSATSTVIDLVNDDMPFLIDSVVGVLHAHDAPVQRILHPILAVRRSADGTLLDVLGESTHSPEQPGVLRESWMHVLVERLSDAERAEEIETDLRESLRAVRAVAEDSPAMVGAATLAANELRSGFSPRSSLEVAEAADLLYWLTAGNMVFLGYRRCEPDAAGVPVTVPGSGLGVLRADLRDSAALIAGEVPSTGSAGHLVLSQVSAGAAVSRDNPPFSVTVRVLRPDGSLEREHHFYGVLTPRATNAEITTIPVLRRTVTQVLTGLGATADSWTGQGALDLLAAYPRMELFWADPNAVRETIGGALQLSSRRRLRAYLQPDPWGRFTSVLVFLPRDRWTTAARLQMQQILLDRLHGSRIRYTARIGDSPLAFVHFTVFGDADRPLRLDDAALGEINRALRATIRTWQDRLLVAVVGGGDEELDAAGAVSRYSDAFDEGYKEVHDVDTAVADLQRLDALRGPDDLALNLSTPDPTSDERRLTLYVTGEQVTLSRVLPVLQSLGAEVLDEKPYDVRRSDGTPSRIYDFGLRFPTGQWPDAGGDNGADGADGGADGIDEFDRLDEVADVRRRLGEAFVAAWQGRSEVDGFNTLVVAAGLEWREVQVLRSYAHYLRQIGTPYTQRYLEQVLAANPDIVADLVELFRIRFDPSRFGDTATGTAGPERGVAAQRVTEQITTALDAVTSLDADRILRQFLALITATARTNAFQLDDEGRPPGVLVFKLLPRLIPGVPKPVPAYEIWVSSPRVEGVHLRFGQVARGGLRWSDRPEDFRTEILGLVKAQEVKNAVIVPVGAKGGFVLRRPPLPTGSPAADREALQAEGIACYRLFVAGLLDVTDNRVGGTVVPPRSVVRHDSDDPYLVVAADKGTASFSDIANAVSAEHGFWLGDAFASGGSVGYDHKAMGITARGAWESVKHHFRELGVDTQTQAFTCVGIGDMSGDVFGNGMLLSEHIRLVAAFDHRHVFIDPEPDAATSFAERRRLFDLPRSSWADYDTTLLSAGGGVWPRTAKSIPLDDRIRRALGIDDDVRTLAPAELIRRVLLAPVDLLWNGGIGTYVKASTEPNSAAGDKANDAVRVNGADLRVKVVGEGGNLGVTQLGRIEFARAGGRINTDAIDNSAGVDTSDHEVNIKIALQPALTDPDSGYVEADREQLLSSMTDEVATLVLADNIGQNRVLGVARSHARAMLSVHARLIDSLVASGRLDRELEFLPSRQQIETRSAAGESLTSPELSVLLAYVKSALTEAVLDSDLPEKPAFASRLDDYFPTEMQSGAPGLGGAAVTDGHPLAREIVTTMTVNETVNAAGITFAFRLEEELAAEPADALRAFRIATEVFELRSLWADVAALDNKVSADCQDQLYLELRRLLDRATRWLLSNHPRPLDVPALIERYAGPVHELNPVMPRLLRGPEHRSVRESAARLVALGTPAELANRVAYSLYTFSSLDIADLAREGDQALRPTAELYYSLSAHLDFDRLLTAVSELPRGDRWHALARQALRDDLYRSMRWLTAAVIARTPGGEDPARRIEEWEAANAGRLARARVTLGQISAGSARDLAALSVAASEVRTMIG